MITGPLSEDEDFAERCQSLHRRISILERENQIKDNANLIEPSVCTAYLTSIFYVIPSIFVPAILSYFFYSQLKDYIDHENLIYLILMPFSITCTVLLVKKTLIVEQKVVDLINTSRLQKARISYQLRVPDECEEYSIDSELADFDRRLLNARSE